MLGEFVVVTVLVALGAYNTHRLVIEQQRTTYSLGSHGSRRACMTSRQESSG